MANYKEQYKKRRRKELKLKVYVLLVMSVTLNTAQFERSLLNAMPLFDGSENAVQIIQ